ncbi:hypothetical protein ACH427_01275 [Streptomyces sp. NPDC020379]|uniref:hypothetical protein n=1 Tax=Streptomyces sp. NPDC020379 TaxID=3365071 RepID=UPI003793C22E
MGWTVLYIAFGIVALWLLGEVLLQYKARLRWRLLAFVGFLGVVVGVVLSSVPVIAVGAIAFAVGQTYVTLSFRRGFSEGWAIRRDKGAEPGGRPAAEEKGRAGRRRKGDRKPQAAPLPDPAAETAAMPLIPESDDIPDLLPGAPHQPAPSYDGYDRTAYLPPVPQGQEAGQEAGGFTPYDYAYGTQGAPSGNGQGDGQFDYGQGQYAPYSDPYIGSRPPAQEQYDAFGQPQYEPYPQAQYGTGAYSAEAYAPAQYDMDTPPGGVWVPQQRDTDAPTRPPLPGHGQGHDGQQYRY